LYASKITNSFQSTFEEGLGEQTRFLTPQHSVVLENAKGTGLERLGIAVDKAKSDSCSATCCHHKRSAGAVSDMTGPSSDSGFVSSGTEGVIDLRKPATNYLVHATANTTLPDLRGIVEFNITTQLPNEPVIPDPESNNYTNNVTARHSQETIDGHTDQKLDMEFPMDQMNAAGNMSTTPDVVHTEAQRFMLCDAPSFTYSGMMLDSEQHHGREEDKHINPTISPITLYDSPSFMQSEIPQDFEQQYRREEDNCIDPAELVRIPNHTENETDSISSEIFHFPEHDNTVDGG
jgi:hypothetical protein